jgi:hypothetical protein
VLVDIVNELPGLGRGEVEVIGGAVPARDAYREAAGAGAESRLAFDSALNEPDRVISPWWSPAIQLQGI